MKKFLILGNMNLTSIMIELLLKGEMWCGTKCRWDNMMPFNYQGTEVKITALFWTNLKYDFEKPFVELTKYYNPDDYLKYDDYDCIEVSKLKNIPMDYTGLMGVPITFIYKLNPNQFELVDIFSPKINGKRIYKRLIIKNKHPVSTENNVNNSVDEITSTINRG